MTCENKFCIYWSQGSCTLETISLDIQGRCQECIYVSIEEKALATARKNLLYRYHSE